MSTLVRAKTKSNHASNDVHDKNKPIECPLCEFTCSQQRGLVRHNNEVHLKLKPYRCPCDLCPYRSATKKNMQIHVARMHDRFVNWNKMTFFRCSSSCPYYFLQKKSLRVHRLRKHSKVTTMTSPSMQSVPLWKKVKTEPHYPALFTPTVNKRRSVKIHTLKKIPVFPVSG